MKLFKKTLMIAFAISVLSLTGCVAVTGESNPDKSFYQDSNPISMSHKYFHNIKVEKTEGFVGTNPSILFGKISPNLNNDTAKNALEKTLKNANMLSENDKEADYGLSAIVQNDGSKGVFGSGTTFSGLSRDMEIQYILVDLKNTIEVYNQIITSHGEADCSDACVFYYLQERYAAERSNADSHRQLIEALKSQ